MTRTILAAACAAGLLASPAQALTTITLYDQDFETPDGFINNGKDVSGQTVNSLYGNQPPGFQFAQQNSVETIAATGGLAFGTGYQGDTATSGDFLIGMLTTDQLGLSFDTGGRQFLNVGADITGTDLDCCGAPFNSDPSQTVEFLFRLYDNPGALVNLNGDGTLLDSETRSGPGAPRDALNFTSVVLGLDSSASTTGDVVLNITLNAPRYAMFDNLLITASEEEGDLGAAEVPLPAALPLLLGGLGVAGALRARRPSVLRGPVKSPS